MSAERSLFDEIMEMADLINHIELVANQKCEGFHISFGISKGAVGHKSYTSIVVCQLKKSPAHTHQSDINKRKLIQGTSVRNLLDQTNEFLKTL